jgi:hypothetical protein
MRLRDIAHEFVGVAREAARHLWPASVGERIGILAALLVAAILRWMFIHEPIRFDEASNALYYADRSILQAFFGSAGNENHFLNSLMVWFSVRLFGWGEASARLPVFLAGVAFVWAQYGFLRCYLRSPRLAMIGAAFAAGSPWLVYFSVNSRGFMGEAVVVTALMAVVFSASREARLERAQALGIWFGILAVCGACFVRSMLIFAATGLLAYLPALRGGASSRPRLTRPSFAFVAAAVIASTVLGLVVFGPRLVHMGVKSLEYGAPTEQRPWMDTLPLTADSFAHVPVFMLSGIREGGWSLILISGLICGGLFQDWQRHKALFASIGVFLLCALSATLAARHDIPSRVFLPASVFFLPMIASAFRFTERAAVRALPAIAAATILIAYPAYWVSHGFFGRMWYTGHIPQARMAAKLLLQNRALASSLVVTAPLYDNGVAFYFREAEITRHNFASGYLKARQTGGLCEFSQVIVYNPRASSGGADAAQSLARFSNTDWYPRLNIYQSSVLLSEDGLGSLIRVPLKVCSESNTGAIKAAGF